VRVLGLLLTVGVVLAAEPSHASADGGTVRLSERQGPYRITVFTSPTPLRAGPVDVSVLVQDAATGRPLPEIPVVVQVTPAGRPSAGRDLPATQERATNRLLRAAEIDVPTEGTWRFDLRVEGSSATLGFDAEVGAPPPRWLDLGPWVVWPVVPVVLFVVHVLRANRRTAKSRVAVDGADRMP
jgi:hypothetical protein